MRLRTGEGVPRPERLVVGTIVKAHGIRGEVSVEVSSDAPERFVPGAALSAGEGTLTVEAARAHHDRLLVKFAEIASRTEAEALRGTELTVAMADARPLPEGSYYPFQLEGLEVADEEGHALGRWLRAEQTPAHDLWVIGVGTREVLVPAVREVVRGVDLEARRIVLRPPPGLFEEA